MTLEEDSDNDNEIIQPSGEGILQYNGVSQFNIPAHYRTIIMR